MKILVNTLLIKFSVFLIFGEFSASGREPPHDHEVEYKHKTIKLWVDNNTGLVTKATYPGSFVPTIVNYYRNHCFLVRTVNDDGYQFVAYLDHNKRLLGVRAQQPLRDAFLDSEPTTSIWHIFCLGKHFALRVDPLTELELAISLVPANFVHRASIKHRAYVAGIEFYVWKDNGGEVVAASLPSQ